MLTLEDAIQIGWRDAHDQAALLHAKELSAAELIEAAILRIEALNTTLNVVSHRAYGAARERALKVQGPAAVLAGVPYLIKDSLDYPGMPSRAGSRTRSDEPASNAYPYIRRFDSQGLVPVGKSSMCEFGLMVTNEPLLYGPARNPWSLDLSTGGSSGGAAAAVAGGLVPLAHASDAAGSIRIPSAVCGLVGLKPSRGANVRARAQSFIDDLLCSDVMLSRSVRDVAWAFAAAHPEAPAPVTRPGERRLRIALALRDWRGRAPTAEVAEALEKTAALCAGLGHRVEPRELPFDGAPLAESFQVLWGYLGNEVVAHTHAKELLEPWTLCVGEWGRQFDGTDLALVFERVRAASDAMADFYRSFDVMLSPVLPERTAKLGRLAPTRVFGELFPDMMSYMAYAPLQNLLGAPAISLPLFTAADGLPLGSMFSADRGRDESLLALALELESAQPWASRRPRSGSGKHPPLAGTSH